MQEFNEVEIVKTFVEEIQSIFDNAYEQIGDSVLVSDGEEYEPTFPCCIIELLDPVSNTKYDTDDGSFRFIDFSLNCDLYSKKLNNLSSKNSAIFLSQILIKGIIEKYDSFVVTRNNNTPYITEDVKRRVVTFKCTYDNENKKIYSY